MATFLYLWREVSPLSLPPADAARQLDAGDDLEGLADLPIKEMLDQLKREFSGCKEVAGLLGWIGETSRWKATWSWQYLRIEGENLHDDQRERFFQLARDFHCSLFDPQMNLRMG
jgi:hypothetical protein